jgi:hypothetical protein
MDEHFADVRSSESGHYSSREVIDKYRADGHELVLIGTESEQLSAPADSLVTSTNWLTHQRKQRQCNEEKCGRWRASRVAKNRVRFGEVRP